MGKAETSRPRGAVYHSSDPAMPQVAVVVVDGRVVFAEVVSSSAQGERLIADLLDAGYGIIGDEAFGQGALPPNGPRDQDAL